MKSRTFLSQRFAVILLAVLAVLAPTATQAGERKLEAVLVWGTNDATSPDPSHKPVSPGIAKKLACLPFKYTHYFEVSRTTFSVPEGDPAKVRLSKDCEVTVKHLENGQVEVTLIGKGQPVGKITQELKKGKTLVTGGNAANATAWFVVLREVE